MSGWARLGIELLVLGGGAFAIALSGRSTVAIGFTVLIALHYAASTNRIEWLVQA